MSTINFIPGPDIVAVQHIPEPQMSSTGIIVETVRTEKYPARGEVIAVGDSPSIPVSVGDIVLYNMAIEEDVKDNGCTFDVVLGQNILGTFPCQK